MVQDFNLNPVNVRSTNLNVHHDTVIYYYYNYKSLKIISSFLFTTIIFNANNRCFPRLKTNGKP